MSVGNVGMPAGTVELERVLFLNPNLKNDRVASVMDEVLAAKTMPLGEKTVRVEGVLEKGAPSDVYDAYRRGLDSACADVIITTHRPDKSPAFLASKRALGKCFGGRWWIYGGAYPAYKSVIGFLLERAEKECGIRPRLDGLVGCFRTADETMIACTTNLCYVGYAPWSGLQAKLAIDPDHTAVRTFTLAEWQAEEKGHHWYINMVAELALMTMPE